VTSPHGIELLLQGLQLGSHFLGRSRVGQQPLAWRRRSIVAFPHQGPVTTLLQQLERGLKEVHKQPRRRIEPCQLTDYQVRRYMDERRKGATQLVAARSGLSERSGRRYESAPGFPSQGAGGPSRRTRVDPSAEVWESEENRAVGKACPGLIDRRSGFFWGRHAWRAARTAGHIWRAMRTIPRSRHDPKILGRDDAEVVGDRIAEVRPVARNLFAQETAHRLGELRTSCVAARSD
jgi:hypothetical protein